ncbi:MAG: NAD-binding protein [Bacteroidota bacterium]|nr:NAD-binding protein [Bacteroidota bacterium]
MSDPQRRLRLVSVIIVLLLAWGTGGYMLLEGFALLDAMYMTMITLATVGYGEVRPLSDAGRVFTIFLILMGVGTLAYGATQLTELLLDGEVFKRKRREKKVARMKNHVIICGYGLIGRNLAERLGKSDVPFVIIESDPDTLSRLQREGIIFIEGDACEDAVLQRAAIREARAVVTTLSNDADNVYIILAVRAMNPSVYIVARAEQPESIPKLRQAGANRVISPVEIGSHYMANAVLHPSVVDFMDVVAETKLDKSSDLEIEEVHVATGCPLDGRMLKDTGIRTDRNIIVLAVKSGNGNLVYNPPEEYVIRANDTLICIGFLDQLTLLQKEAEH